MSLPRVLVIDNDAQTCIDLVELLTHVGFAVYTVDPAQPLLADQAQRLAEQHRPHVAIVDLRLQEDFSDDYTGFDVLHHLASAHCILYSAYLTVDAIREVKDLLYDWAKKHDSPQQLRGMVAHAATRKSVARSQLQIVWPDAVNSVELASAMAEPDLPPPPPDMLEDIILQLWPAAKRVELTLLQRTHSEPSGASRRRSSVFLARPDNLQPTIVKFALSQRIAQEEANYRSYVQSRLPGLFASQQHNVIKFWDLGGITYTFMGARDESLPTLAEFYHRNREAQPILNALNFFFRRVWIDYYRDTEPLGQHTLWEVYDQVFKLRQHEQTLNLLYREVNAGTEFAIGRMNPISWVIRHAEQSRIPTARQAITHGDLHADNLFVESERMWAIDFERTGFGHVLRDFAELEVDLLTRLLSPLTVDDPTFHWFITQLTTSTPLRPPYLLSPETQAVVNKAQQTVRGLRTIATEIAPHSPVEYGWALLLDSLFVASITTAPVEQRRRAMLLSIILCEHLREMLDKST